MNNETVKTEILPGITIDAPKTETKTKYKEGDKYIVINPKEPYVKARDGELDTKQAKSLDERKIDNVLNKLISNLPEDLKDGIDFDSTKKSLSLSLDEIDDKYKECVSILDKVPELINIFNKTENQKFLPYLGAIGTKEEDGINKIVIDDNEREKLFVLLKMLLDDRTYLRKELDTIRSLYSKYMEEVEIDGKKVYRRKEDVREDSVKITEEKMDILTRYFVFSTRVNDIFNIPFKHVSDFYSSMVYNYYINHPDEAPDDVKELIKMQQEMSSNTVENITKEKEMLNTETNEQKENQDGE